MPSVVTRLLAALERLSLPMVTAESCTAGALASALTSKPASPSLCLGGVTSYSLLFKQAVLGVPEDIIRGPGEVSEQAMARCVLLRAGLLDVAAERAFKRGALRDTAQGIGVSTTGYLDNGELLEVVEQVERDGCASSETLDELPADVRGAEREIVNVDAA